MSDSDKTAVEEQISVKCRVGGLDARRVQFKGYVEIESFARNGYSGSFCVFRRDEVRLSLDLLSSVSCLDLWAIH